MILRKIAKEDYSLINKWCEEWKFPCIAQDGALPDDGFIVSDGEQDILGGFLYFTNSIFAHPEWIVSNREYKDRKKRKIALKMLMHEFENLAKSEGYKIFLMSVKNPYLIENLINDVGFSKTDVNMTNLIKIL